MIGWQNLEGKKGAISHADLCLTHPLPSVSPPVYFILMNAS